MATAFQPSPADQAAFNGLYDIATLALQRKYRWARRYLRLLEPVPVRKGTLAVDKFYRLYWGPTSITWTQAEFTGALWHELHHLLRRHPERLEHLPKHAPQGMHTPNVGGPKRTVNVAADLEVNDDLKAQGITLPAGLYTSEVVDHSPFTTAEEHWRRFVETWHEGEEERQKAQQERKKAEQEQADDDYDDEEEEYVDDDSSDSEQPDPDGGEPQEQEGDEEGEPGDGEPQPAGKGDSEPADDGGDEPQEGDGEGEAPGVEAGGELDEDDGDPCWDHPEELDEPEPEDLSRLNRDERRADEEMVEEAQNSGGLPPGMGKAMLDAAIERLGRSEHDWRKTIEAEVRTAMEQRADEAEEYTFRRQSRRAVAFPGIVLPGSYRPIPNLTVILDVSGSMDQDKLRSGMREVHGILDRLAIPEFVGIAYGDELVHEVRVSTQADVEQLVNKHGGGTDMQAGVDYAVLNGAEVVVVLTDCQTTWAENAPKEVPVIIGAIAARGEFASHDFNVPSWARMVEVEEGVKA